MNETIDRCGSFFVPIGGAVDDWRIIFQEAVGALGVEPGSDLVDWNELLNAVLGERFRGLVVFGLSGDLEQRLAYKLQEGRPDILVSVIRLLRGQAPSAREKWGIDEALAFAYVVCMYGGSALVLARGRDLGDLRRCRSGDHWDDIHELRFRVGHLDEIAPMRGGRRAWRAAYLGALTLRRRAGFDRSRLGFSGFDRRDWERLGQPPPQFGYWAFSPEAECDYWVGDEFTSRTRRINLDKLARAAAEYEERGGDSVDQQEPEDKALLIKETLLCVIRASQVLSFRTLEGTPFSVRVVMPLSDSMVQHFERTRPLVGTRTALLYDFDHLERLGDLMEIGQSESIALVVSPLTGRVAGLYHLEDELTESYYRGHRQRFMANLADRFDGFGLFLGDCGHVEVYAKAEFAKAVADPFNDLHFYCSGPRWEVPPGETLRDLGFQGDLVRGKMESTILSLLDQGLSSILVVLPTHKNRERCQVEKFRALFKVRKGDAPKREKDRFEELLGKHLEEMRRDIYVAGHHRSGEKESGADHHLLPVNDLTVPALTALFRIDGAHFLSDRGEILALGLRVTADSDVAIEHEGGSGSLAAILLAREFEGSKVLKVSASGKLKFHSQGDA